MKTNINTTEEIDKTKLIQKGYFNVIKILLVVATDTELKSVLKTIKPFPNHNLILKCFEKNQTYYLGVLGCFAVCLVKITMMGSIKRDASFATVTDALDSWNIKIVIMPGIAFGRDEKTQKIGDILISEILSQYDTVKEDKDGKTINRGFSVPGSSILLNRFGQIDSWNSDENGNTINIYKCEILSGEKLVNNIITRNSLFERFPNAKGGEMEGNGVYSACDRKKVDWIICKSICDWADGNKDDEWQTYASNISIGYVNYILSDRTIFKDIEVASIFNDEVDKIFNGERKEYNYILGLDIVNIIFPKHQKTEHPNVSITKERIYYEFIEVHITESIKVGYLFFAKQINIDKTIFHFFENQNHNYNSLVVCSPIVKSDISGRSDYRLGNIEKKFITNSELKKNKAEIKFHYIEELVWNHCMPHDVLQNDPDIPDEKYFIDQEISYLNQNDEKLTEKSLKYFSSIFESDSITKPMIAVLGGAGVGKTTLCDQLLKLIHKHNRKKAIYISSSDVEANDSINIVRSIADLYKLAYSETVDHDEELLSPSNLKVNISCGNIIVIIDGLDEIESKLKEKFDFSEFIKDAEYLNSSYNNCTIIVTCRDFYKNKYENNKNINLLLLMGFDDILSGKYFEKRVSKDLIPSALKQLASLNISDNGYYPPVILSLVCDILESEEHIGEINISEISSHSRYLFNHIVIDSLIVKLIDREIERQSLNLTIDDVLDLLFEIASTGKGEMLKSELNEYIRLLGNSDVTNNYSSFYVNPLLRSTQNDKKVIFRYDSLLLILRSRYFNYRTGRRICIDSFIQNVLIEFYDGTGDLLRDIILNNSHSEETLIKILSQFLSDLTKNLQSILVDGNVHEIEKNKKYISAILYYFFGCFTNLTRKERSQRLVSLFSGNINYMFIYKEFYPLDFEGITINNSGFYYYTNFEKSIFPVNFVVFFNSVFKGIEPKANLNAEMDVFDKSCRINKRLKNAIVNNEDNKSDLLKFIKSDFITLFNVLYKNRLFVTKSENIFRTKKSNIYPKLSIEDYLSFFLEKKVFERQKSYSSESKYHYNISKKFMSDIRYLITNNNFRNELEYIYREFLMKQFGIEY